MSRRVRLWTGASVAKKGCDQVGLVSETFCTITEHCDLSNILLRTFSIQVTFDFVQEESGRKWWGEKRHGKGSKRIVRPVVVLRSRDRLSGLRPRAWHGQPHPPCDGRRCMSVAALRAGLLSASCGCDPPLSPSPAAAICRL